MNPQIKVIFTDENIHKLFGHEAAEDEDSERLQEYYLKNDIYNRITANLPLRILVGHKGIGKSALFKIAMAEDKQKGNLPVFIRPDDLIDIGKDASSFLETIRDWKKGLKYIIAIKVLEYAK
jgi:predicted AAA+ superfamily ATPase